MTQIAVDVSAGPFKDRTVLFLGSEDGRVLKAVVNTDFNQTLGTRLLEDIDVYSPSRYDRTDRMLTSASLCIVIDDKNNNRQQDVSFLCCYMSTSC